MFQPLDCRLLAPLALDSQAEYGAGCHVLPQSLSD